MSSFAASQTAFRFYEDSTEAHANCVVKDANSVRCMVLPGPTIAAALRASTPDSVATSITGDIDVRVKARARNWKGAAMEAMAKCASGQLSWILRVNADGTLKIFWSPDNVAFPSESSTIPVPFGFGDVGWIRVTLDVDNGAGGYDVKFYTSLDGSSWTQLGSTVTGGSTTSIYDSTADLQVGAWNNGDNPFDGPIYYAELRNGIGGSVVAKFDPATDATDAATSFTSSTGETWTMNGTQILAAQSTNITRLVDGIDSTLLLRIRIQETGGKNGATTDDWQLQYSKDGGAYTSITTTSSNVKGFGSVALTDAATTTQQLTAGTGSFVSGEIAETGLVTDRQLTASNFTELLYTLQLVDADLNGKASLNFRVLYNGATITYSVTPSITVLSNTTALSSTAAATGTLAGASKGTGALSSTGASTATLVGTTAATIATGAASSTGAATATLTGQSRVGAPLTSAGAATGTLATKSTASSALASAGAATGVEVGASLSSGDLSSQGASSNTLEVVDGGSSPTVVTGDMSSAGAATAILGASSSASADISAAGTSTAIGEGASQTSGNASSDGVSTAILEGTSSSLSAGDLSSAGVSVADVASAAVAGGALSSAGAATAILVGSGAEESSSTVVTLGARHRPRETDEDEVELLVFLSQSVAQLEVARQRYR